MAHCAKPARTRTRTQPNQLNLTIRNLLGGGWGTLKLHEFWLLFPQPRSHGFSLRGGGLEKPPPQRREKPSPGNELPFAMHYFFCKVRSMSVAVLFVREISRASFDCP